MLVICKGHYNVHIIHVHVPVISVKTYPCHQNIDDHSVQFSQLSAIQNYNSSEWNYMYMLETNSYSHSHAQIFLGCSQGPHKLKFESRNTNINK